MRKFLKLLREALDGEISPNEIEANVDYYRDYIDTKLRQGYREKDILDELGDPLLIARTIIEANNISGQNSSNFNIYDGYEINTEYKESYYYNDNNEDNIYDGKSSYKETYNPIKRGCMFSGIGIIAIIALIFIFIFWLIGKFIKGVLFIFSNGIAVIIMIIILIIIINIWKGKKN